MNSPRIKLGRHQAAFLRDSIAEADHMMQLAQNPAILLQHAQHVRAINKRGTDAIVLDKGLDPAEFASYTLVVEGEDTYLELTPAPKLPSEQSGAEKGTDTP